MSDDSGPEQAADIALTDLAASLQQKHEMAMKAAAALSDQDIRRLNVELLLSNRQLATANADLEAFSYSVAHDLRSPIRQIAGFSKLLVEDFGPQLPADAQRYLGKVMQGAQLMGGLIDDLLHLAQVGRQPLSVQVTPLDSVMTAALELVQSECAGRNIEWQIDALDSVRCDRGLMKQVFVNLLANAVKYTRSRHSAVIHVGQMCLNDERIIFVRDNGVGFDMCYADKLFGVFHRMHSSNEFEGSGIGLATVERIIRKHGGHVWAEAEPDHGATFYFTVSPRTNQSL